MFTQMHREEIGLQVQSVPILSGDAGLEVSLGL